MTAGPTPNNERRWVCAHADNRHVDTCTRAEPHPECADINPRPAPVPSPAQGRPDTVELREIAGFLRWKGNLPGGRPATVLAAADWIDAQPAADQGPDLSELRAAWRAERAAADLFLADPNAYTAARNDLYATLARLLNREGGS